jgi:cyclophilin family peptidyl-prolyl cis-trans isomerase
MRSVTCALAVGVALFVAADVAIDAQGTTTQGRSTAQGRGTTQGAGRGTTTQGRGTGTATPAPAGRTGGAAAASTGKRTPGGGPVILFETAKGNFEIETYPAEAPKSVEHVLALVKRNFYNGLRVHRYEPGFVIQFGDPQSRDMTKRDLWGTRGSGQDIGVSEANPKRTHVIGAVALAHAGDPRGGDSQLYVLLAPAHRLDGKYTVIGGIIAGMDVVNMLRVPDVIRRASVK